MTRIILAVLIAVGGVSALAAQDPAPVAATEPHAHKVIELDSAPIVKRLPTGVRQVRRILREPQGTILVCEWETGTVLRIHPDGNVQQVAFGLHQPSDVAVDKGGNVYVSEYADGLAEEGTIVRFDAVGQRDVVHENLNGPSAMEFDRRGNVIVAEYQTGRILRITSTGDRRIIAQGIESPSALAFDAQGRLYIAGSKKGELVRLDEQERRTLLAEGLKLPSDIQFDGRRRMVVTSFGDASLAAWDTVDNTLQDFGSVPRGTIAATFGEDDNFVLGHWEFDFLMSVTRTLKIKCPHCDQMIPVHLVPTEPKKANRFEF